MRIDKILGYKEGEGYVWDGPEFSLIGVSAHKGTHIAAYTALMADIFRRKSCAGRLH